MFLKALEFIGSHPLISLCLIIIMAMSFFEFYRLTMKHITIWIRGYPPEKILKQDSDLRG